MQLDVFESEIDAIESEWSVREEVFIRVPPPDREEFYLLLDTVGSSEIQIASNKGFVRFRTGSTLDVDISNLSDICISMTPDVVQYLSDSVMQHWREQKYLPFELSFKEFGAAIKPRSKDVIIQATSFFEIQTEDEMDEFLTIIGGLHDSILREVAVVGRSYVDTDGYMYNDTAPADARLVIQTQFPKPTCIEIVLEGLQTLKLEYGFTPEDRAIGIISQDGTVIPRESGSIKERGEMALARRMRYRILGREYLGRKLRAVQEDVIGNSGR